MRYTFYAAIVLTALLGALVFIAIEHHLWSGLLAFTGLCFTIYGLIMEREIAYLEGEIAGFEEARQMVKNRMQTDANWSSLR